MSVLHACLSSLPVPVGAQAQAQVQGHCQAPLLLSLLGGLDAELLELLDPLGVEIALLVEALVGVRAEKVALRLREVRGQARAAVHVVVRKARGKGRRAQAWPGAGARGGKCFG